MPPKKKATAAAVTQETTSTITTKRGREIAATAAATRPKRDAALSPPSLPTGVKETGIPKTATKKRGRPAKAALEDTPPAKRGRKAGATATAVPQAAEDTPKKRGPGRPPKVAAATNLVPASGSTSKTGKKRGRPSKAAPPVEEVPNEVAEEEDLDKKPQPKKRGRPAAKKQEAAVPDQEAAPPKRRGRPPKGGETTKINADDDAAAGQLEEELQDTAEEVLEAASGTSKAPLQKPKRGKGKAAKKGEDHDDDENTTAGRNYWLMKAEQEDREEKLDNGTVVNTRFTIDDLRSKSKPEPWDGVRNPTAAKNMREMKKGDLAFFYASGGKNGRKPGIVGIMEIVKEHELDQTAWDPNTIGFVQNEKQRERWCVVHVEFRTKFAKPVFLSELQKFKETGGALANLQEFKAARLSVSKVSEEEWTFIMDNLVEGNETGNDGNEDGDDDGPAAAPALAPKPNEPNGGISGGIEEVVEAAANDSVAEREAAIVSAAGRNEGTTDAVVEPDLSNGLVPALFTVESDPPTTDGLFPHATSATGRGASQASSLPARVAPLASSSRPSSRAGRARSRTPNTRQSPVPASAFEMAATGDATGLMQAIVEEEFAFA